MPMDFVPCNTFFNYDSPIGCISSGVEVICMIKEETEENVGPPGQTWCICPKPRAV